jgi:RimJ/RimL family protein N-acetyltransferase
MSAVDIKIRPLTGAEADAILYRDVRLEALSAHPEAFGSSHEYEAAQPLSWFSDRLASSTVLGAFRDAELVGIVGLAIQQGAKKAHKGTIVGMYVRPDAGTGRLLMAAIIELARRRVELVQLTVVRDNERAKRLYAGIGFHEYGMEWHSLKHDGRYYDEILMAKDLLSKSNEIAGDGPAGSQGRSVNRV